MNNLFNAIKSNLIAGGAYSLVIKALISTLVLTVLAVIIACVVGAVLSYFMCYEYKYISAVASAFSFLFRSTPVLLFMLFLDFGPFRTPVIPALLTAAVAIGLYGAGHLSELVMKSLTEHEDFKSKEIRKRLRKAFFTAAFPEGLRRSMFQLKRLLIQLFQWTTVAGYIGVNELTKVLSDIGNRTMYPFFSIMFSTVIYLCLTVVIELLYGFLEKKFKTEDK
ncbi:MAG: hypothetical protein J6113_08625 [Lachnospiraceae bacterium]|nr:hypothetical protein [Lachnospiraceae bacterium]